MRNDVNGRKAGNQAAVKLGRGYSVVLGSEKFYPRTGYLPAGEFGIELPFPVTKGNSIVCRCREGVPEVCGIMEYAEEFGVG